MTLHLSRQILNALADGELSSRDLASTNQHLNGCSACTSNALYLTLLKSATSRAGQRFVPPLGLQDRIMQQFRQNPLPRPVQRVEKASLPRRASWFYGWAAAAVLVLVSAGSLFVQRRASQSAMVAIQYSALAAEACDEHIATLAANQPPQVISSDRHTVKPWFQGKLPFSFNLPENLPSGMSLDGANLTYIHNRPAAQLLYSIGQHRVSVYLEQEMEQKDLDRLPTVISGFYVVNFNVNHVHGIAVSDADLTRLSDLASRIKEAQTDRVIQPQ